MTGQTIPILLNLIAAVAGAAGQYLYKRGALKMSHGAMINGSLIAGGLLFCLVMVFFVVAYRLGGRISVVYPFYATTFVWGALMGVYFDGEPWRPLYLVGAALVLGGLVVIALASEPGAT